MVSQMEEQLGRLFSPKSKPFMLRLLFNRYWLPHASIVACDWSKNNTPGSPAQSRPPSSAHVVLQKHDLEHFSMAVIKTEIVLGFDFSDLDLNLSMHVRHIHCVLFIKMSINKYLNKYQHATCKMVAVII